MMSAIPFRSAQAALTADERKIVEAIADWVERWLLQQKSLVRHSGARAHRPNPESRV